MPSRGALSSAALSLWMVAVVAAYVSSTVIWLNPEYLRWGLPFFQSFPPLLVFAARTAGLGAGLAVLCLSGLAAGGFVESLLGMRRGGAARTIATGWVVLGTMVFGLGLAGLWWSPLLAVVIAVPALAGIPRIIRGGGFVSPSWPGFLSFPEFLLPASLAAWVVLLLCLSPEAFQDPLRYHLFIPSQFLTVHKVYFYGNFFFWSYMGPIHMLYAAGLALAGTSGAKAVNLACAILCLRVLDRIASRSGMNRADRALLQAVTVTGPGWVFVTGSAFMEHGGVLYILLALEALLDGERSYAARSRDIFLLAGMAASVKYTSIFGGVGLAVAILFGGAQKQWERALTGRWPLLALLLLVPFMPGAVSRWLWTGDPVSPLLARWGIPTMDSSSLVQLDAAYAFAHGAVEKWLANPAALFSYPMIFSGSHGGFWEHPGPALACLLPVVAVAWKNISAHTASLLWFFAGSVGFWLVFFGGVSPHYIVAYGGVWCAALLLLVRSLPDPPRLVALNALKVVAFYQALTMLSASTTGFFPRDAAFGVMSQEQYIEVAVVSKRIYRPIRRALEAKFPDRGVVYTYGDDRGYYLAGRVCLDYDFGSDPAIWRLAAECRSTGELRKRIRQRGWTHMIYSTYWPDFYENEKSLVYRFDSRVLNLMQDFWREYAGLELRLEIRDEDGVKGSYVYAFRDRPVTDGYQMDGGERLPYLPGAEGLFLPGDRLLRDGRIDEAADFYAGRLAQVPDFAVLHERMGRLAVYSGRIGEARAHVRALEGRGWRSASLRRLAWPAEKGSRGGK